MIHRTLAPLVTIGSFTASFALASACLEAREGSSGGRTGDAEAGADDGAPDGADDTRAADGTAPEEVTSPDTTTPDTTTPDVNGCDPTAEETIGALSIVGLGEFPTSFTLVGREIYAPTISYDQGQRYTLQRIGLDGERRVVWEGSQVLGLLDARDGAVLFETIDQEPQVRHLHFVASDGAAPIELGTLSSATDAYVGGGWTLPEGAAMVTRDAAVWGERLSTYGANPAARVVVYREARTHTLFDEPGFVDRPTMVDGAVLWRWWQQDKSALFFWSPERGEVENLSSAQDVSDYRLTRDAIWWVEGGRVMRRARGGGEHVVVHEGPCSALTTDETRVAAVCGAEASAYWLDMRPGTPTVFDGTRTIVLPTLGGDVIASLRIEGARAAWVEYPAQVGCDYSLEGRGQLVLASLAGEPRIVAPREVMSGCWCCDAYWPSMTISLSREAAVWNYPTPLPGEPEPEYPERPDALGFALFACP